MSKVEKNRAFHLQNVYGLSVADYEHMYAMQDGLCAICKKPEPLRAFAVDHDHVTGKIRELLCSSCNIGLANFHEDPDLFVAAMHYLGKHS